MSEQTLTKACIDYLNYSGHYVWRNNTGMFFGKHKGKSWVVRAGKKGSSDILGIHKDGRFMAIEVKLKYNKPTVEQELFINEIIHRGGIGLVVYSLEDLQLKMTIV